MEQDSSGLYHTQSRYYSPTFGRFLSADAGFSPNLFAYVGDNPINAIDPTGEYAEAPPVCSGWCAVAEYAVEDIIFKSIETGNLLKGIEDFLQSVFDPGNIFGDWFGGGGSQPTIPPGYYRHVHYPAGQFIGSPYAITPNMEDSFHREAPFDGRIIWVNGPTSPPTAAPANSKSACRTKTVAACFFDMLHGSAGLLGTIGACSSQLAFSGAVGPVACVTISGIVVGSPTAYIDYQLGKHCVKEFNACDQNK